MLAQVFGGVNPSHTLRGDALQIESEPDSSLALNMLVLRGKNTFFPSSFIISSKVLKLNSRICFWSIWCSAQCAGNIRAISTTLIK